MNVLSNHFILYFTFISFFNLHDVVNIIIILPHNSINKTQPRFKNVAFKTENRDHLLLSQNEVCTKIKDK